MIIDYFGKIDEIKTDVEPTYHVFAPHNVFGEDVDFDSLKPEEALVNSPKSKDGYFGSEDYMTLFGTMWLCQVIVDMFGFMRSL